MKLACWGNASSLEKILPNGGRVFIGGGACVPFAAVEDLLAHADRFHDVEIVHIHTLGETPWVSEKYDGAFRTNSFFLSSSMSQAVSEGRADYTPSPMSEIPWLFENQTLSLDLAIIQCTPPDTNGMVSLGLSVDVVAAAVANAKTVVAQINPMLPHTGAGGLIPFSKIHYHMEFAAQPTSMEKWHYDSRHVKIGQYASQLIEDGSTIQSSMGNSPQAVLNALENHKDLGIHTGCFTNAMMRLVHAGAVTNLEKTEGKGKAVASHCIGSNALYDFVSKSGCVELHDSSWCNNPLRIAQQNKMVAVNGASEVDLTGQIVRDSKGHHFYGGIGATQDFIRGAAHSKGGRPIIALTSMDDEGRNSRIVTGLSPGSGVCTSRGDTHYVVTEYGIANLVGRSIKERVLQLVEVAHPKYRETLLEGALLQGWIPKSYNISYKEVKEDDESISSQKVKFTDIDYIIRPIHPSDMRLIQELFYNQDEENIRLRYGYNRPMLDDKSAYTTSSIDQSVDLALGVFYTGGLREKLRATGRFYRDEDESSAEISFLVHERARRRGIANYLLTEMAKLARERGIKTFWASVLKENTSMAGLFKARGAKLGRSDEEDSYYFTMLTAELIDHKIKVRRKRKRVSKEPVNSLNRGLGIYFSEKHLLHDTGVDHPESVERYQKVLDSLMSIDVSYVSLVERTASSKEIILAHDAFYHDMVKVEVENFSEQLSTGDTSICEDSYEVAALATGAVLNAVDGLMKGKVSRAFCAVRPPGHHATQYKGMGFCIFNHVAIAAKYVQKNYGVKRVAIMDWDVHHGNGTQDIFYEDPNVFYFSTHQEGGFPYSGSAEERGRGKGEGTTYNIPLKAGTTDEAMLQAWQTGLKKMKQFKPEIVFISAGFDAAIGDPLGDFNITVEGFAKLTEEVRAYAEQYCDGRIVSVLEGGYDPDTLAACVKVHVLALC